MKIMKSVRFFKYLYFLPVILAIGCTHTVRFYEGSRVPDRETATLESSFLARVKVDQKETVSDLGTFVHKVHIKLLPNDYLVEWKEGSTEYTHLHRGKGVLKAQAGQRYVLRNSYLPGATHMTGASMGMTMSSKYLRTQVLDYASWIENMDTQEVVVGTKPPWVGSISKRPQILYLGHSTGGQGNSD